jgi:hypothetical protein
MAAFLETAQFLPEVVLAYFNTFSAAFWSTQTVHVWGQNFQILTNHR